MQINPFSVSRSINPSHPERIEGGYRLSDNQAGVSNKAGLPLLSLITVVRNGEASLEKTIQSVLKFNYSGVEYIIIDGASTDGTLNIIKRYDNKIAYWRSEPDKGIYNAMNKGWLCSQGHFVYFLGADDTLLHIPYKTLQVARNNGIDFVYGNVLLSDGRIFKPSYNRMLTFTNTVHHQGLFLRRNKFTEEPFKEQYRVFADFDLNQRLFQQKAAAYYVDESIACFNLTGVSVTTRSNEFFQVIFNNYGVWAVVIAFLFAKYRGVQYRFWQLRQ